MTGVDVDTVGSNYLSLPLIPASGTKVIIGDVFCEYFEDIGHILEGKTLYPINLLTYETTQFPQPNHNAASYQPEAL